MRIQFTEPCELEVTVGFDEATDTVETENDFFCNGEVVEVDIVEINDEFKTATIQFGDGSVAYGVPTVIFDVLEEGAVPLVAGVLPYKG